MKILKCKHNLQSCFGNKLHYSIVNCFLVLNICSFTHSDLLEKFTSCNNVIDMTELSLNQGELSLAIKDLESIETRVSCDFTIKAGPGRQVMFYFTDMFLGAPNRTERVDKACIEPRDKTGPYEIVPTGMRAIICSRTEVEIGRRVYSTAGSALSIRFYRNRGYSINVYFKLVFTAFRTGSCRTSERKCNNARCIAHDIVCNGHNPCGDGSDCPTGLEHLSSFTMSGIVVLALLSGGIIIIMAAVCLQRTGSKRYDDFDSITLPINGTVCQDHHHVEMNEVMKQRDDQSQQQKWDQIQLKELERDGKDDNYILDGYSQSVLEVPTGNDRERLIQYQRNSSEVQHCLETFAPLKQNSPSNQHSTFGDLNFPEIAPNMHQAMFQHSTEQFQHPVQSHQIQHIGSCQIEKPQRSFSERDGFYFSGNSLLCSDSESEREDEHFKVTSLDRQRLNSSCMTSSNSNHCGTLRSDSFAKSDLKPTRDHIVFS